MQTPINKNSRVHFIFLDSFRGLMALFIVITHTKGFFKFQQSKGQGDFFESIAVLASSIALPGFFYLAHFYLHMV